MNTALSLSPLLRQSVGFDRFNDFFESALRSDESASTYPPYNIERRGEDNYTITMAVAGFLADDLNVVVQNGELLVSGDIDDKPDSESVEYLHRGIATRAFERTFRLADHMQVTGAEIKDGLLCITLVREIPEEAKPRMIPIEGADGENNETGRLKGDSKKN